MKASDFLEDTGGSTSDFLDAPSVSSFLDSEAPSGPEWISPEDARRVPLFNTVLGGPGKAQPIDTYGVAQPERLSAIKEGFTTSPLSQIPNVPSTGESPPGLLEKASTFLMPQSLPMALGLGPTAAAQFNRSLVNSGKGLGEFLTSPAGILTAPLAAGTAGKVVASLVKLGFSADMADAVGAQAGEIVGGWDSMTKPERVDKLTGLGLTAAMAAGLAAHTAPEAAKGIASALESDSVGLARLLEQEANKATIPNQATPEAQRRLGIKLTAEPFLQPGIPELADQALREAQSPIILPDPAIEQLRREISPPQIVGAPRTLANRDIAAGDTGVGPSIEGLKVSPRFRRSASDFLLEREQPSIESEKQNALDQEAARILQPVRDQPVEGQPQAPAEVGSGANDAGGNIGQAEAQAQSVVTDQPLNPGGSVSSLSPELQAKNAEAVAAGKKIAEEFKKSLQPKAERVLIKGQGPQGYTVVERLTPTELEKANGEQPIRVKNERTGKEEIVLDSDVKAIAENAPAKTRGTTKVDLNKALREVGLDPSVFPDAKSKKSALDRAIAKIEEAQAKIRGSRSTLRMGVPAAILDTALETARLALKAGKSIQEAVEAAIKHIRFNVKGFDENQARSAIQHELVGVKSEEVKPSPKVSESAPPSPEPKGTQTLADVYKIFEPEKSPSPINPGAIKRKVSQVAEAFGTGLSSKFRPLNKLAEDIAKTYGGDKNKNVAAIFEQLKGSQGKGEADVYRFDRDVSSLVKGNEKDFNAYMFLRRSLDRLQQDAKDISGEISNPTDNFKINRRAVGAHTIRSLTANLAELESKLGPEKTAKFQTAADQYQKYMDQALRLQVESGRMSEDVYKAIKSGNQFYAPFKVMKYLEETSRPEGSGRKVDTLADFTKAMTGIEDPNFKLGDMLGAARQSIIISRILADKNQAMRNISDLALQDTEHRFIKKVPNAGEVPIGMNGVNVLENGKAAHYAVDPEVADAIQSSGENGARIISRLLGMASQPFRAGATALNLPFQVSNLLADVPRSALVSKYGINGMADMVRFPIDLVHSLYSSMAGDIFGRDNKLFLDFLDSGVAGTTIQEHLTPNALKFQEPTAISKSRRLAKSVLNIVPEFAAAIEQTSKILGVKRAMRFEGVTSGKELAARIPDAITEIRRFSGSPDFGRQGKWVEQARLNLLYMFLNARIQGAVADVGRLAGRDGKGTAAKTWFRLTTAIGLPTAYLYYLNNSPEYKKDYDSRPKQEKDNYWLIPKDSFITTESGEKLRDYWRIPKRESSKWIANMTESALNFADKKDPASVKRFAQTMIEDISPVNIQGNTFQERMESTASSLNPLLKAPLEFSTGRDMYRHRQLVPDSMKNASPEQQYTDRTPEVYKKLADAIPDVAPDVFRSPIMLENLTGNLTAGLISQFLPRKPIEGRSKLENTALLQRFQAVPYTDRQDFNDEVKGLEREAADAYLERHRKAAKIMEENPKSDLKTLASKANRDPKLIREIVDLYTAKENGATPQDRMIIGLPAKQRAQYIAKLLEPLNPDEKAAKIKELARKRILTETVAAELPAELLKKP